MDIVYRLGRATAADIHARLPDPPHAAAVRTMLRILEDKRQLRHEAEGRHHVYMPVTSRGVARKSAVKHLLGTFFGGSRTAAVAALLQSTEKPLSRAEREELDAVIRRLRAEGR